MALFTDGILTQLSDLADRESSILNVATMEGVDTQAKRLLAQEEIGSQIKLFLLRDPWIDPRRATRRMAGLCDVVVAGLLKRWHVEKTIAMIYGDAYSNQLNDRYLLKLNQYQALAQDSSIFYFQEGVGLVYDAIPKASSPSVTAVNGSAASQTYYFATSWLNSKGQEGALSDTVSLLTSAGSVPMLTASSPPPNAVGWNIYGGADPGALSLQYSSPLVAGTLPTWTLPVSGLIQGNPPGRGQTPEQFVVNENKIQRG